MRKLILAALVSIPALLCAGAARAAEVEEVLGADTIVLVKLADLSRARKDIDATALGKIAAEPEVKEYLQGVSKVVDQLLAKLEQQTGLKKDDVEKAFGTEIAAAMLGPGKPDPEAAAKAALAANESNACGSLRAYCSAQTMFKRNDWDGDGKLVYAPAFAELSSTKDELGEPILLVDAGFAAAGPGGQPKYGYRFQELKTIGGENVDWVNDYALCAVPAEYGKTGKLTLIVCTNGTVFGKDLKGEPVADYPADPFAGGWEIFEGGEGNAPSAVMAVLARVGDVEAAGRVVETLRRLIPGMAEAAALDWPGATGWTVSTGRDANVTLFRAGAWQALCVATPRGQERVKELAASMTSGRCAAPLAADAEFTMCRQRVGERSDLLAFVSGTRLTEYLLSVMPAHRAEERAEAEKVLAALGIPDMKAVASTLAIEPPGFRNRTFLACNTDSAGVLSLLGTGPLDAALLKLVPANAVGMQAFSVRFGNILPLVRRAMDAAEPGSSTEMDRNLAQAKEGLGFDPYKDILGALGERVVFYSLPPGAAGGNPMLAPVNGLTLVIEAKDAKTLQATAEKLTAMATAAMGNPGMDGMPGEGTPPVSTFEYRGVKVTSFNINNMAAPGFAVTDKYLLLGANVQNVKRAIARLGGEAAPGLVETEQYAKAAERVKGDGDFAAGYSDMGAALPSTMATAGIVAGIALPAMTRMQGAAKGSVSQSNLRQTGVACQMYAADNEDKYPADLKSLMPMYVDNPRVFLCPGYGKHAADGIDYAYVPGLTALENGDWIVAYETLPDERGLQATLFVDCHVESLTGEELAKRLAAQKEAMAKAKIDFKPTEPAGVERGAGGLDGGELGQETFLELLKSLADPAAMPPADTITKHLFPMVAGARKVEGGLLFDSFGPLGPVSVPGGGPESVAGISVIAAIAIPSLLAARRGSLETNAVGTCRAYCAAQTMFKRNDWDGDGVLQYAADFPALCHTKDANGMELMLIDAAFAQAKGPAGPPRHGYVFYNLETIGGEKIDWVNDYGICAVPSEYGRTGYRTFIVNTNGTVFGIDNMGQPVTDYPADPQAEGWIVAE